VTGGTTCLDYGDYQEKGYATQVEFETCKTGDTNQIFALEDVKATVTSTTAFPDPTTICHIGQQQILKPSAAVNITQQVCFCACITVPFAERGYSILPAWCLSSTARHSTSRPPART
jgi:hypothetical protein